MYNIKFTFQFRAVYRDVVWRDVGMKAIHMCYPLAGASALAFRAHGLHLVIHHRFIGPWAVLGVTLGQTAPHMHFAARSHMEVKSKAQEIV